MNALNANKYIIQNNIVMFTMIYWRGQLSFFSQEVLIHWDPVLGASLPGVSDMA